MIGGEIVTNAGEAEPTVDPSPRRRLGRVCLVTSNFPRWIDDSTTPFVLHLTQDLTELGWQIDVLAPQGQAWALGHPSRRRIAAMSSASKTRNSQVRTAPAAKATGAVIISGAQPLSKTA